MIPMRVPCIGGPDVFLTPPLQMTTSQMFSTFLDNLIIRDERISKRYGRITAALNKEFRNTESKTDNSLQVGSYGRRTGIQGLSDLDMLYYLPKGEWDRLKDDTYKALKETRDAIITTYSATDVKVDRLVVVVEFDNYLIEVQPVFQQDDGSFLYPDTKREEWLKTMPREEMAATNEADAANNGNLRDLCKMTRAWRNKHGLQMGGLLVDTLCHRFITNTEDYKATGYASHGVMFRDFLQFLADEPKDKSHYKALGSGQNVRIKKKFQRKAKKGLALANEALDAEGDDQHDAWRKVFGRPFPKPVAVTKAANVQESRASWADTEEFVEDKWPVDIRYSLKIDCAVSQNGYRTFSLLEWLGEGRKLAKSKSLKFEIVDIDKDLKQPYSIHWKVLNRGERARALNCIRGTIWPGTKTHFETTSFRGQHLVECYIVKNNVVVAKDRISVPIEET